SKRVMGWKGLTDLLVNLASSISQSRIDYVISHSDYFTDLLDEKHYYEQLNNVPHQIDGVTYTYRLVKNYSEIEANIASGTENQKTINIVLTIEGGHAFNTGLDMDQNTGTEAEVIANVEKVKQWEHPPVFITFAHHFYNELCGHARSISIGALRDNQNRGLDTGITPLGEKVIRLLLDKTKGSRIPIDIKHMSKLSRGAYYKLLDTDFASEKIPVIASHGAVNGQRSLEEPDRTDHPQRAEYLNNIDINFYDDELIRIAKSNGMFGIQLDERRVGSKKAIKKSKMFFPNKRKQLKKKSLLVWRQVEHIAEVLNKEGLFCWGVQCIGSDFDGIVDPINGLWTAENIKDLGEEMVHHASAYLAENGDRLHDFNKISAATIVEMTLHGNAMAFLQRNF
ncbi:MAG: membrane dipeptidase, partial [Marinirhabdus sp.]